MAHIFSSPGARRPLKILAVFAATLSIALLAWGCVPGGERNKSALERMLEVVPPPVVEAGELPWIEFSNVQALREVYGLPKEDALRVVEERFHPDDPQWSIFFWATVKRPRDISTRALEQLRRVYGYDFLSPERAISVGESPGQLIVMEGPFVKDVLPRLQGLGYEGRSSGHGQLFTNGAPDFDSNSPAPQGFDHWGELNRIGVDGERLVASSATAYAEKALDVWSGSGPSAASDPSLVELAQGLGDVLHATLVKWTIYKEPLLDRLPLVLPNEKNIRKLQIELGKRYEPYEPLHIYDWLGVAVAFRQGKPVSMLALHYPDPEAASRDREAVLQRMKTYTSPTRPEEGDLIGRRCPSLEGEAKRVGGGSVLLFTCGGRPLSHDLFREMLYLFDVAFLVVDP